MEGGDVLVLGNHIYVGVSGRTNKEGLQQFVSNVAKFGYIVHPVQVNNCLHLKSAVTAISANTLLINPAWVDSDEFSSYRKILVDNREPYAANALLVDTSVIYPTSYPRTLDSLLNSGTSVFPVDVTELIKAEGAVTCCSIIFRKSQ
jgi:dimethylargininase